MGVHESQSSKEERDVNKFLKNNMIHVIIEVSTIETFKMTSS